MDNVIELDRVDALGAGAIGEPGERVFYIQADKADARLTVVVEKEQVALLAAEAVAFLDRIGEEYPEEPGESSTLHPSAAQVTEPAVPLFRARMIGLGLRARPPAGAARAAGAGRGRRRRGRGPAVAGPEPADDEGYVARIFATRAQVRAMAARGRGSRRRRSSALPALQLPDGPGRPHLPAVELDPAPTARRTRCARASSTCSVGWRGRRTRRSSSTRRSTTSRCPRSTSRSAASARCGTSPTGRCATARSRPTSCREALGWSIVPETVLRDGPYGIGMVQRFVDHDPDDHYFTLLEEHMDEFQRFAVFDVLANNADRKGGHCLLAKRDGHVWGIDHGLTFHVADKLRTVIWDFAGEPVPDGDPLDARVRARRARRPARRRASASSSRPPRSTRRRPGRRTCCAPACSRSPTRATTPSPGRWSEPGLPPGSLCHLLVTTTPTRGCRRPGLAVSVSVIRSVGWGSG